jgi:type I restriction enzyme, S subunit
MSNAPWVSLNDSGSFSFISGLWKGSRAPLQPSAVLRSTNFRGDGLLDYSDIAELDVDSRQLAERQLQPGDIIIERSGGGPKQPVGRVGYFDPPDGRAFCTSNFTTALRVLDLTKFNPKYVALYLHALYQSGATETLQRATTGIRNLDWNEYQKFEIPQIAIEEQKSIVHLIGGVRSAYRLEEAQIENFSEIKRTSMREVFTRGLHGEATRETEFGQVPETWQTTVLDDCAAVQTGVAKGRKFSGVEMVDVPYLRVANVQDGHLDLTEMKKIHIRRSEVERYRLQTGDVVLTEGGDFDKLGRGFIWRGELDLCVHQNHVFAVRPDRSRLMPEFFAYLAQSAYGKAYFLKVAHKTTNLACINSTKLKAFPVLIPPTLDEQREIVAILHTIDRKIGFHTRKRAALEDLFKALLHKLISDEAQIADLDLLVLTGPARAEAAA